jgi:anti-sigma B factor antagonist
MGEAMLKIECRESRDVILVDLVGRMSGGPDTRAVKEVIKSRVESGHRRFVLNMTELDWMTSIGIGTLVEAYASVKKAGGVLVLLSPTERVAHTLEMTRLIPAVFKVFHEDAEAAEFFMVDGASSSAEEA